MCYAASKILLKLIFFRQTVEYIEDLMCQQVSKSVPLSLLCLLSLTNDGLNSKDCISLRRQFLQAYGHKFLYTFRQLEKLGVLQSREKSNIVSSNAPFLSSTKFANLCKKLELVPRVKIDLQNPVDPSYVFNGIFTPALCKLVQIVLRQNGNFDDELLSQSFGGKFKLCKDVMNGNALLNDNTFNAKVKLIYFVGGVTYAEIAALRLVNKVNFPGLKFVIAATHVINKEKLFNDLSPGS